MKCQQNLEKIEEKCGFKKGEGSSALDMMRKYYNGYSFDYKARSRIYNPTLALYFFGKFNKNCEYPEKMLDSNLAADEAKLEYISRIPGGRQLLLDLPENDNQLSINELEDRFGIKRMLEYKSKDFAFMASFLYYFGVLTMTGKTETGELAHLHGGFTSFYGTTKLFLRKFKWLFCSYCSEVNVVP